MKTRVIICVALLILIFLFGQNDLMALKGPKPQMAHPWAEENAQVPNSIITSYLKVEDVLFLISISINVVCNLY